MKYIEIVDKFSKVLFSHTQENNTISNTLELGVKQGVDFNGAILDYATLRVSNFKGAKLKGASLVGAKLEESCLSNADLSGADLEDAILEGVDLSKANLQRVNLRDANLQGANLEGSKLHKADLEGANLDSAILTDADFGKSFIATSNVVDTLYSSKSSLDSNYQHLKYFFEGYRETALSLRHGSDYLWDVLEIDQGRYSPGSAREVSYRMGSEQAKVELI